MAITAKEGLTRENGIPFVELSGVSFFNAEMTFECGQCFRFDKSPSGGYEGVAYGRALRVLQPADDHIILYGSTLSDYETVWRSFLSLDEDYESIQKDICERFGRYGDTIYEAVRCASGIRILRQEPWEALCSFILSQNNNIPRIKKIISTLCRTLGKSFSALGGTYHKFPTAKAIADAGPRDLFPAGWAFARDILSTRRKKCQSGEIQLDTLKGADTEEAEAALTAICGVGKKVAACTMSTVCTKPKRFRWTCGYGVCSTNIIRTGSILPRSEAMPALLSSIFSITNGKNHHR